MDVIKIIKKYILIFLNKIENIKFMSYNEFTIENYLRKKVCLIGKGNRIYTKNFGSEPYLVKIGNHCTIAAGVLFITHDGGTWVFRNEIPNLNVFGKIEIKNNCFIGITSIILPNISIGPNSVVGAGSVVTKDVPPNTVVAGVPARVICSIEEYKEKCINKWEALSLRGLRDSWEEQLKEYFWGCEGDR